MWLWAAIGSAVFAGLTTILVKCGVRKTDSDVATALRTVVVLLFSILMVFVVGSQNTLSQITVRSWVFLILSGLATGASWICYFRALSLGDVNRVAPIDKSSTVLTALLAILLFHETGHLAVKLIGIALIGTGTYLMIEKKTVPGDAAGASKAGNRRWVIYAILSAVFAALTSILAKIGIAGVESNLATAIRTSVVLLMAWLIVIARGKVPLLRHLGWREGLFIALSGVATGASWLFYYYAIQTGAVSVVVPIDKMSILLTVFFSCVFLHEKLSRRGALGLSLMALGTLAMAIWA